MKCLENINLKELGSFEDAARCREDFKAWPNDE